MAKKEVPQIEQDPVPVEVAPEIQPTEASKLKAEEISADDLALPLSENMPEPTEAKFETQQAPLPSTPSQFTENKSGQSQELRDDGGENFDPKKHRTDSFGNPIKKNGRFLSRRGRPSKDGSEKAGETEKPRASEFINNSGQADQFDAASEMMLQTGYGIGAAFFSDEVRPESAEEHAMLKIPLAAVLREKGVVDMTPTQMLMLSLAAYIGKKAMKPTVKERAQLLYLKIRSFFGGKKPLIQPVK